MLNAGDQTPLRKRTLRAMVWTALSAGVRMLLNFITIAILTRFVSPSEFGLIGMVVVFSGLSTIVLDFGLGAAIIQSVHLDEEQLSSVFWVNVIIALLLMLIFNLIAPTIARFYHEPRIVLLMNVISLSFIFDSFRLIQRSLLAKALKMDLLAIAEIVGSIISSICAIVLAYHGFGVWSLVWQTVALAFSTSFLLWIVSPWRPKWTLKFHALKELMKFGMNLLIFNFINYWSRSADRLLIGRGLGASMLGFYTLAYQTMQYPVIGISQLLGKTMFPSLSLLQNDHVRFRRAYLYSIKGVTAITFPIMAMLAVVASPFIRIVYSSNWEAAILPLQILCVVGALQSITSTSGWLFQACGKTDSQLRWGILWTGIYILAIVIGLQWGIIGVACVYGIADAAMFWPSMKIPLKFVGLNVKDILNVIFPIVKYTGLTVFVTMMMRLLLQFVGNRSDIIFLLVPLLTGSMVYGILIIRLFKEEAANALSKMKQLLNSLHKVGLS